MSFTVTRSIAPLRERKASDATIVAGMAFSMSMGVGSSSAAFAGVRLRSAPARHAAAKPRCAPVRALAVPGEQLVRGIGVYLY